MKTLWGIANPDQLAALKKLLEQYGEERGRTGDKAAIDRLANRTMDLFTAGHEYPRDQAAARFQPDFDLALRPQDKCVERAIVALLLLP